MSEQTGPDAAAAPAAEASEAPPGADVLDVPLPEPPAASVPDDAKDTRGKHFRSLLGSGWVMGITGLLAIGAFVAGASQGYAAAGAGGAGVVLLLALLVVFLIARSRAADDFFTAYAQGRGLQRLSGKSPLPPVTPLLRRGDDRYAQECFSGGLPGGLQGQLAHYTYEDQSTDSNGNRQTTYYHFTVAITQLPETAPFMSEMALQRRSGFRFMDSAEDVFRKRKRVELESVEADRKYEIFIGQNDDMVRARRIFSPTFVVWLADHAPEGTACELHAGAFVLNVKGHKRTAHELDEFCMAASAIARRMHEEATEAGPGLPTTNQEGKGRS